MIISHEVTEEPNREIGGVKSRRKTNKQKKERKL